MALASDSYVDSLGNIASVEDIAWAAGFFEGEGCLTKSNGRPVLRLSNADEVVLRRFSEIMGVGVVYGPYANRYADGVARADRWVWVADGLARAHAAYCRLEPWLSARRRKRAAELFP